MSIEFFDAIQQVEDLAKKIKFLDGSHPAVGDKYTDRVSQIRGQLESLDRDLTKDLATFLKTTSPGKVKGAKSKRVPKP